MCVARLASQPVADRHSSSHMSPPTNTYENDDDDDDDEPHALPAVAVTLSAAKLVVVANECVCDWVPCSASRCCSDDDDDEPRRPRLCRRAAAMPTEHDCAHVIVHRDMSVSRLAPSSSSSSSSLRASVDAVGLGCSRCCTASNSVSAVPIS